MRLTGGCQCRRIRFEANGGPAALRPTRHDGIESRLPWVDIGRDLPGHPTDVDPRP